MKKIAFLLILFNCFSCLLLGENYTALAAEQVEVFAVDMDSLKRELEHG